MKSSGFSLTMVIMFSLAVLTGRPGWAVPLQYHGGPILETCEIYPLYYGQWTKSEIDKWHTYVVNVAAYMSWTNAPASEQPMMKQYGVNLVTVAAAATASPDAKPGSQPLTRAEVLNIIAGNQATGNLPAFSPHRLIVVFPGQGFSVYNGACGKGGGCHSSQSTSAFWAVIPQGQELVVVAHEIFETSADPADDTLQGWDEAVDQCDNAPNIRLLAFGNMPIPPATDNTNGGGCSTTGYTKLDEIQVYAWTYAAYLAKYNELFTQGWRLYIFQAYVLANGDVRYNAVWRPAGNTGEQQIYGATYAQFRSVYDTLYPQGWRLYILQAYVLPGGNVLYNAVWRPGDVGEHQDYGVTYERFLSDDKTFYTEGWRPYILQSYGSAGQVLYNAVWRPGDLSERRQLGGTYAQLDSEYHTLYPQAWRRPGDHGETAVYGGRTRNT